MEKIFVKTNVERALQFRQSSMLQIVINALNVCNNPDEVLGYLKAKDFTVGNYTFVIEASYEDYIVLFNKLARTFVVKFKGTIIAEMKLPEEPTEFKTIICALQAM